MRVQARENLTVLASLDNGRSFTLSLSITTGPSGYSALQCGLPGVPSSAGCPAGVFGTPTPTLLAM